MVKGSFDYLEYPRKLNLGCGFDLRAGYLNVDFNDFHNPDLLADVRKLDMLPTAYYDEIIAQDVLEHLPRADTGVALAEWARLLRTAGTLRLRVPNIFGLVELFSRPENDTVEQHELLIQSAYGTQAYEGDYHLTGFTERLLDHYLRVAGFTKVRFQPRDEWLFDIVAEREDFKQCRKTAGCV